MMRPGAEIFSYKEFGKIDGGSPLRGLAPGSSALGRWSLFLSVDRGRRGCFASRID